MANNSQATKFVDGETKQGAAVPGIRSSHGQLLNLTGEEIDRALDVLEDVDGVAAPISGLRCVMAPTVRRGGRTGGFAPA